MCKVFDIDMPLEGHMLNIHIKHPANERPLNLLTGADGSTNTKEIRQNNNNRHVSCVMGCVSSVTCLSWLGAN